MITAKIFENGRSQAVRLPKEYRFNESEVKIGKIGDIVFLVPIKNNWDSFMHALDLFSDDFLKDDIRNNDIQKRETL